MWEKIKKIGSIVCAVVTIIFCTVALFLLRRGKTDGRGSRTADDRDTRIQEGITDCEGRAERIEERIESAENAVTGCEEHLQRAEDILRRAIERSRE